LAVSITSIKSVIPYSKHQKANRWLSIIRHPEPVYTLIEFTASDRGTMLDSAGIGTRPLSNETAIPLSSRPASGDLLSEIEKQNRRMASSAVMRFKILRSHAEGGLGKVFVARDQELNREVALKEIRFQYADDESARARFVMEAEVTGGLEHPSIVPVCGLECF